jgi:hypothetical protein
VTDRYDICSIKGGITAHLIRRHLIVTPAGVETFCNKRGLPGPLPAQAPVCHDCLTAVTDTINGRTDDEQQRRERVAPPGSVR